MEVYSQRKGWRGLLMFLIQRADRYMSGNVIPDLLASGKSGLVLTDRTRLGMTGEFPASLIS